jgi:hypothetical protein
LANTVFALAEQQKRYHLLQSVLQAAQLSSPLLYSTLAAMLLLLSSSQHAMRSVAAALRCCRANNKLRPEDVKLGNLQRQFRSLVVDQQDRFAYAGSTTGDVMQVRASGTVPP